MNRYRIVLAQVGSLLLGLSAHATVRNAPVRITILDSETRSVTLDGSGVPKNCDGVNFDAYCLNSKTSEVTNTLLVEEGNRPPYYVACTVDAKWSRCVPLPKGSTYDASKEKRGLLIYYADDNGKLRKQLYTRVPPEEAGGAPSTESHSPAPTALPVENPRPGLSRAQAPAEPLEFVKCSFTSTPAGAEVTLDGKFAGSTPSLLSLGVGTHSVKVTMPGFGPWTRELTVSPGSELTVNAVLEKDP